jgi:hypothetical protein
MKERFTVKEYATRLKVCEDSAERFLNGLLLNGAAERVFKPKKDDVEEFDVYGMHTMEKGMFRPHDPFNLYQRKIQPLHVNWIVEAKIS